MNKLNTEDCDDFRRWLELRTDLLCGGLTTLRKYFRIDPIPPFFLILSIIMSEFSFINSPLPSKPPSPHFSLTAAPKTDIYAAPSHGYVFSAPILYRKVQSSSFHRVRLSIKLQWTLQYDQGGLILIFPSSPGQIPDSKNASTKEAHPKWVKAGIEINDGQPFLSVVARDEWADWSLSSLPSHAASGEEKTARITLELQRHGNALMVLLVDRQTSTLVREVQWVFCDSRADVECLLGVYVARPDAKGLAKGDLEVEFEGLEIVLN